jgi:hypothetical protein
MVSWPLREGPPGEETVAAADARRPHDATGRCPAGSGSVLPSWGLTEPMATHGAQTTAHAQQGLACCRCCKSRLSCMLQRLQEQAVMHAAEAARAGSAPVRGWQWMRLAPRQPSASCAGPGSAASPHASPGMAPAQSQSARCASTCITVCASLPCACTHAAAPISACRAIRADTCMWPSPVCETRTSGTSAADGSGTPRQSARYSLRMRRARKCSCIGATARASFANSRTPLVSMSSLCSTCTTTARLHMHACMLACLFTGHSACSRPGHPSAFAVPCGALQRMCAAFAVTCGTLERISAPFGIVLHPFIHLQAGLSGSWHRSSPEYWLSSQCTAQSGYRGHFFGTQCVAHACHVWDLFELLAPWEAPRGK